MGKMAIELKINPIEGGGIVVIGEIFSASPPVVWCYKNKKDAIKQVVQNIVSHISWVIPPDNNASNESDEYIAWLTDFQKKLEWICKD